MRLILTLVHVVICLALIIIILLQRGKGADMGAVFGGSSQTVFGSSGAMPFLQKLTAIFAVVFMLSSLGLALYKSNSLNTSVMKGLDKAQAPVTATTQPASKKPVKDSKN